MPTYSCASVHMNLAQVENAEAMSVDFQLFDTLRHSLGRWKG